MDFYLKTRWKSVIAFILYLMTSRELMDSLIMRSRRGIATLSNYQTLLLLNQLLLRVRVLAAARHAAKLILTNWATRRIKVSLEMPKSLATLNLSLAIHKDQTLIIYLLKLNKYQIYNL